MSTMFLLFHVEVLHLIFDHLDYETILCSVRLVRTQLYAIVNSYDRYVIGSLRVYFSYGVYTHST